METRDKVLDHFEKICDAFDGVYDKEQSSLLYKLVDILFRNAILEKRRELTVELSRDVLDKKILDIGCGAGRYAIELARKNPALVLGIDISPSMVNLAREKARLLGLGNICKFENIDFMDKDFQDKFDLVIAAGVFDYIESPGLFLSKIRKVLKEKAILSFPVKWTLMTPVRMAWLLKRRCPNYYYTKSQIKKMLNSCGFDIASIYRIGSFIVPGNYVAVVYPGGDK